MSARSQTRRPGVRRGLWRGLVTLVLVTVVSGCGGGDSATTADPPRSPRSALDFSDADLWLDFEDDALSYDGQAEFLDALGGAFAARLVTANDGAVDMVPGAQDSGWALGFPDKCTDKTGCPRAMLEVQPDPALDPGIRDFEFGASVFLPPNQTTTGSNIVQRGRFDTDGGLWKLQVDSNQGRPSCVVRSGKDLVSIRSSESVADSTWHHIVCRRDAEGVSITVDDTVDTDPSPTGSVSSEWPLRIGSPGVGDLDDQFHGYVDNVFLRIGP